ncbi:unnamed protein product [Rhizoctonia solani]|uniref:Fungal lipase-type domain-containing protein n=1 Tax=Rhizoctonia solani TaxID=456999 RepID=A0A8H3GU89_9AGAM|nr:unnamed protein product [Rhizoctonia solani]
MPAPDFDQFQQVFALSWASNLVGKCKGTAAQLQAKLSATLGGSYLSDNVGPGWNIVWGPAVYQNKPDLNESIGPDNVWFVAKHDNFATDTDIPTPVYVVSIAGTADQGQGYNGKVEDMTVDKVVNIGDWIQGGILSTPTPAKKPDLSKPHLAYGTALGTHIVASTPPVGQTQCLANFLKETSTTVSSGTRLIFTGHSLGGALSPSLAFVLDQAGYLGNFSAHTLVYPTAGPSPGNPSFVSAFSERFPTVKPPTDSEFKEYRTWNRNIVNTRDVVPNAWCTDKTVSLNLHTIPTMYGNDLLHGTILYGELLVAIAALSIKSRSAWDGWFKKNVYDPLPSTTFTAEKPHDYHYPTNRTEFGKIALDNHIKAYVDLFFGTFKPTPGPCAEDGEQAVPVVLAHILGALDQAPSATGDAFEGLAEQLAPFTNPDYEQDPYVMSTFRRHDRSDLRIGLTQNDTSLENDPRAEQTKNDQLASSNEELRRRVAELESEKRKLIAENASRVAKSVGPEFQQGWDARTAARIKHFFSVDHNGNISCAWHDSRRECRVYPPHIAPPGHLNCGCTYEEGLFEESLARHGVGCYHPGESVRMEPALRNPLLKLLQHRFGYQDGDFERDPQTGLWVEGEGPEALRYGRDPITSRQGIRKDVGFNNLNGDTE